MAQLNDLLVMGQSTLLGPLNIKDKIIQGNPSSDSSIASMNRFESDVFVAGNGSAPISPTVPGFYLGKSANDNNRHMDIVSGSNVAYIDFNKDTYGIDYSARLYVDVETGVTKWTWGFDNRISNKTFSIEGNFEVSGSYSSPASISNNVVTADKANALYYYGTDDAVPGTTQLATGKLYFVYED